MGRFGWAFLATLALFLPIFGWAGDIVGFQTAVSYPVGHSPQGVAVADFNGDGNQDVVVVCSGDASAGDDGGISILLGNGDGTLRGADNIAVGKNPVFVAVGDLSGDGKIDLLVVSPGDITASPPQPGIISVLLGNGDGTFSPGMAYNVTGQLYSLVLADFAGNNRLAFVLLWTPSGGQPTLTMWPGNGDGTFQQGTDLTLSGPISTTSPAGTGPSTPIVADFNGDHIPDLAERVVVNPDIGPAYMDVLLGKGDGTFQAPLTSGAECTGTMAVGDVNGDGRIDIVDAGTCAMSHIFRVGVLPGHGDGTFSSGGGVPTYYSSEGVNALADLNGDGFADLVGVEAGGPDVLVNLGNGDGSFQWTLAFDAANTRLTGLALADLNNDKAPDFVASNNNNTVAVLLNKPAPDFTISAAQPSPATVTAGQSATSVVTITMLGAYANNSFVSCSVQPGPPNPPTCSLEHFGLPINPGDVISVNPGQSTTVTLTIQTSGAARAELSPRAPRTRWFAWPLAAAFALTWVLHLKRDGGKRMLVVSLVGILVFCLLPHLACGGSSSTVTKSGGTTYTIVVTDSVAWGNGPLGLQQAAKVTLTVE